MHPQGMSFLADMARDVIEASRVRPNESVADSPKNVLGATVIRPGGRVCYPALWPRDFSMSLDCGLISAKEVREHLQIIARAQNGAKELRFRSGAVVGPWSIPDHINFDGGIVYFPGGYSAGEDQGGEPFGTLPPVCDHYEFVHITWHAWKTDPKWVEPYMPQVIKAFDVPESDEARGGVVTTSIARRAVGYGFYDAIHLSGALLYPSLLRFRAATELAQMTRDRKYQRIADSLLTHIEPIFGGEDGWLIAATELGHQPDVWGTLYALHLRLIDGKPAERARAQIADLKQTFRAAVRHSTKSWPKVVPGVAAGRYQNGAYWHTATGWLIEALQVVDAHLATRVFDEYISHLRDEDFRKGERFGAPWECIGDNGNANQNPVYMASVTVPLSILQKIAN